MSEVIMSLIASLVFIVFFYGCEITVNDQPYKVEFTVPAEGDEINE